MIVFNHIHRIPARLRGAVALRLRLLGAILLTLFAAGSALAQSEPEFEFPVSEVEAGSSPSGRMKTYQGYYFTEIDGETVPMVLFNEIVVFPPLKFRDKKEEEFYWRTVRDVKKTLPYAKLIYETLLETYEYIETIPSEKEREDHLKRMEKEVFNQYKPVLKKFSRNQARMLLKLINRETDQSGYSIIKAFLGTFRAGFWQAFGRLFGVNLKGEYKPESDRQDAIIERVAVAVEQGRL